MFRLHLTACRLSLRPTSRFSSQPYISRRAHTSSTTPSEQPISAADQLPELPPSTPSSPSDSLRPLVSNSPYSEPLKPIDAIDVRQITLNRLTPLHGNILKPKETFFIPGRAEKVRLAQHELDQAYAEQLKEQAAQYEREQRSQQNANFARRLLETTDSTLFRSKGPNGQDNGAGEPKSFKNFFQKVDRDKMSARERQETSLSTRQRFVAACCFVFVTLYSVSLYFDRIHSSETKLQDERLAAELLQDDTELDYTTLRISNDTHSVSPLAQEIIDDIVKSLDSTEKADEYFQMLRPLPAVLKPQNAIQLPLFVAHNPTKLQASYNAQRDFSDIYSTPPLNNNTIDLFLNEAERTEREFRRSHDKSVVRPLENRPKNVADLTNKIRFQMGLSRF